jgi:hypothetical protein
MMRRASPLLLGLATLGLCAACGDSPGAAPGGSAGSLVTHTPMPTGMTDPTHSPLAADPADPADPSDPADLPAVPGARRTSLEREVDDGLTIVEIEYLVAADIEAVRRHYRRVMQVHGWRVGEADVDDDGWELQASKGDREVEVEIEPDGDGARIEVNLTDLASTAPERS